MRKAVALLYLIAVSHISQAAIIHVPADQPTIQAGIDAASAGDTVQLACGTYYEHDVRMKSAICLRSETGAAGCATINAEALGRCLVCLNADAQTRIEGVTFRHGRTDYGDGNEPWPGHGAGVLCDGSSPQFRNCRFWDCYAYTSGAGLGLLESPGVLIENCRFDQNETHYYGAALASDHSSATVVRSQFIHNTANDLGGAVSCTYSTVDFADCTFAYNEALHGGALRAQESHVSLSGCTLVWNKAQTGGGLYLFITDYTALNNCLIAFSTDGHAIHCAQYCGTLQLTCCDLFGNADGDWTSYIVGQLGQAGNVWVDPLLCGTFGSMDFTLDSDSVCLPTNNACGVLIGAWLEGCGSVGVEATNWGRIKSLY